MLEHIENQLEKLGLLTEVRETPITATPDLGGTWHRNPDCTALKTPGKAQTRTYAELEDDLCRCLDMPGLVEWAERYGKASHNLAGEQIRGNGEELLKTRTIRSRALETFLHTTRYAAPTPRSEEIRQRNQEEREEELAELLKTLKDPTFKGAALRAAARTQTIRVHGHRPAEVIHAWQNGKNPPGSEELDEQQEKYLQQRRPTLAEITLGWPSLHPYDRAEEQAWIEPYTIAESRGGRLLLLPEMMLEWILDCESIQLHQVWRIDTEPSPEQLEVLTTLWQDSEANLEELHKAALQLQ